MEIQIFLFCRSGDDKAAKNICLFHQGIPLLEIYTKEKIQRCTRTSMHTDVYYNVLITKETM